MLFWLDQNGLPAGLFYESTADCAAEVFGDDYHRFFSDPSELNGLSASPENDEPVGILMNPRRDYFCSKTFNLMVKASANLHSIDLKVDVENQTRAVFMLFRKGQTAFDEHDASHFRQALPYLRHAIERHAPEGPWEGPNAPGHILVDWSGTKLLAVSDEASQLLNACAIVGQDIRVTASATLPPRFAEDLCRRLETAGVTSDILDIPWGRLRATATQMHEFSAEATKRVLISLEMEVPKRLRIIHAILDLPISPLQRLIALVAAEDGSRADCLNSTGISKEALKKHLSAIYRVVGVNSWEDLAVALQRPRNSPGNSTPF
ncbi:hypothetical protein [Rhizobium sp. Root1220]|uniref:hypothetical protein n=1 Tax=Rhizobium sp. Root1220 TaxID=1736432 RepID=UPI0012E3C3FC|nr:hypothetical protein [Rhizobium sp. Root1220]